MTLSIDWDALQTRANGDGEFSHAARRWTATLRLDVGDESRRLRFEDGTLTELATCSRDSACDVFVTAPREAWAAMLEPTPKPFYQDLYAAQLHHGFEMNPEGRDYAAYYPALRRLVELLRELREDG